MLTQEILKKYKQKLEEERTLLEQEIKELEKAPNFGDASADPGAEEADEAEEMSTQAALGSTLRERLHNIEHALSKIVNGEKYGVCESCSKDIEPELLDINPESTLCKECKLKKHG